ncbi:MAG: alpha-hydroxy-acid oxidizing protein [Gemmatimonadaceae bacterium]|nr:alpha-hydroxy-acid oxidizing protein [Gemmatimonadaceae bacterium]
MKGAANSESTLRRNHAAFDWISLVTSANGVPSKALDTSVRVLDRVMPVPIIVGPTSAQVDINRLAERATYRAAAAHGITMSVSQFGLPLSMIAAEAQGHLWAQMYPEAGARRVDEAEAAGAEALILTIDEPYQPNGERSVRWDLAHLPAKDRARHFAGQLKRTVTGRHTARAFGDLGAVLHPRFTTSRSQFIGALVKTSGLPVLVKGILSPEDADMAIGLGAAGVIVSNHGGRALDGCISTIEALPDVVRQAAGRVPVFLDSGVRRGADVLKACALGATAVLIGRPVLWGLGAAGEAGVARVLEILTSELVAAMALTGTGSIRAVNSSIVRVGGQ